MTVSSVRAFLLRIAPWITGATIILGLTMVFPEMAYNYANSKSIIIQFGFGLIIAIAAMTLSWEAIKKALRSKIVWGLGAVLGAFVLASLVSIDPTLSWFSHLERGVGTFFVLITAIGALSAVLLAQSTGTLRQAVLYPLVIGGSLVGLSTILAVNGLNLVHWVVLSAVSGGGGLTGNSSFAGTILMMNVFLIVYLLATAETRRAKVWLWIALAVSILNPVMIGYSLLKGNDHGLLAVLGEARGAMVSLVFGLLISLGVWLSFHTRRVVRLIARMGVGALVTLCLAGILVTVIPGTALHQKFNEAASPTRFLYWNIALQSAKDHPVLGTGPETFRYAHEHYFNSDFMRKTYKRELFSDKPHNAYLEMLDTQGAVGVVAYVFLIAMLAWFLIRSAKDEKNKWFVVSMAGLLAAYLLNNFILFDTNMSYLLFFLIVAWFVSRDAATVEGEARPFPEWSGYRTIAAMMGLAIFVLAAVLTIMQGTKLRVVLKEMYAPLESRIGMYAKSEKVSPYGAGLSFGQRADVYANNYLAHMNEIVASDAATQKLVLADIDAIKAELENKFARFPKTAQAAMAYGRLGSARIAVLNTLDPVGLKMMRDGGSMMMALSPNNPQGYWILAQAYAYEGKFAEAKELLRKALDLNPRIPESYQIMIEFTKMSNDPKLLQEMMVKYSQDVLPEDR